MKNTRRDFIKHLSLTLPLLSLGACSSQQTHRARVQPKSGKLGIALVGLGKYSAGQLAPALRETEHCYLAGIVTGTPAKAEAWKKMYNIPTKNIYSYDTFDEIIHNQDFDVVYIVLPNALHAEYTIRAAKAGKHVICEKPMATSVKDAERMLKACRDNGVQLSIGYRLHYEPFHQHVMELGQKQKFGKIQKLEAFNSWNLTNESPDVWRLNKKLAGGGPLMDLGIYCVQAANYTLGKVPVAVTAKFGEITNPNYFYDVEESIDWQMEYDDGFKADCKTSYASDENLLSAKAESGWWKLSPAYVYEGKKGETSQGPIDLPNIFEQASQMDAQVQSFRDNVKSRTSGEMGLLDMKILMAIYESANAGGKRILI